MQPWVLWTVPVSACTRESKVIIFRQMYVFSEENTNFKMNFKKKSNTCNSFLLGTGCKMLGSRETYFSTWLVFTDVAEVNSDWKIWAKLSWQLLKNKRTSFFSSEETDVVQTTVGVLAWKITGNSWAFTSSTKCWRRMDKITAQGSSLITLVSEAPS